MCLVWQLARIFKAALLDAGQAGSMNAEDLILFGLMGAVIFLLVRQQPTSVSSPIKVMTPQGSSYPVPGSTSYVDPQTGHHVNCPTGQVVIDVGDLVPSWTCGLPGTGWAA